MDNKINQAISAYNQQLAASTPTQERTNIPVFRPRAVLFDMDGVLYNSMPHHAIAWQKAMARFGLKMTADDAYATEGARGIDTIRHFVKKQLNKEMSEEDAQKIYDVKTEIFHSMGEAPIFPGVLELMAAIKASGMRIGIVTGSGQRPLIHRLTKDFGEYITEKDIVTAYDVKRGKPYPDPYLMGLEKAGQCLPYEGIVVENAPLGVKAGVAANAFTVAINSGPLDDHVLLDQGAHVLYPSIEAFLKDWDTIATHR